VHGCGWDSGAAREPSSALAASVASRYVLGADGVGDARPGARGSRVTASRYALGAEGGGAARPGAYIFSSGRLRRATSAQAFGHLSYRLCNYRRPASLGRKKGSAFRGF